MSDIKNFVWDFIKRGTMQDRTTKRPYWQLLNIAEPSLKVTTEKDEVVDNLKNPVMNIERAKKVEFSANNSFFDLDLFSAQSGASKKVADGSHKIRTPKYEEIEITSGLTEVTLKENPVDGIDYICLENEAGGLNLSQLFTSGVSASETKYVYSESDNKIKLPTGLPVGSRIFIAYTYESENGIEIESRATDFPKSGEFVLEGYGCDLCNKELKLHAFLIIPNAELSGEIDQNFQTDANHSFTITGMVDYCTANKVSYRLIVVRDEE